MSPMRIRQIPDNPKVPRWADAAQPLSDLGSQLEDLVTHVMKCERWARFDDRLDLAYAVQQAARPIRRR
jgi:hypothetical protein